MISLITPTAISWLTAFAAVNVAALSEAAHTLVFLRCRRLWRRCWGDHFYLLFSRFRLQERLRFLQVGLLLQFSYSCTNSEDALPLDESVFMVLVGEVDKALDAATHQLALQYVRGLKVEVKLATANRLVA